MLKFLVILLVVFPAFACVAAKTKNQYEFPLFADIRPSSSRTYALPDDAPPQLRNLLILAVDYWNSALGAKPLSVAPSASLADVKVLYTYVERVQPNPAHTQLLGCLEGYSKFADCIISVDIPRELKTTADLTKVAHLFRQGPLDAKLFRQQNYRESDSYLIDKLILLSFIHEIGHTLGLDHSQDRTCMMAEHPDGSLNFCDAELQAARLQLKSPTELAGSLNHQRLMSE